MSEDKQPAETASEETEDGAKSGSWKQMNKLTRSSDQAPRPGFRAPSNKRSKATKKKRKKR